MKQSKGDMCCIMMINQIVQAYVMKMNQLVLMMMRLIILMIVSVVVNNQLMMLFVFKWLVLNIKKAAPQLLLARLS